MRRSLCIGLALLLAAIVGRDAALAHWRPDGAGSVPHILANDPALRMRAADSLVTDPASLQGNAPAIRQAAIALLRQTPLDASVLRKLAIAKSLHQPAAGQDLVALAERVSRRDLTSELLLIDAASQQVDVAVTLSHYDHALSVYPAARQQLFPLLASELSEPEVRAALVPLASRPWMRDFILNAVDYDAAPDYLMDFYANLSGKVPLPELQAGAIRVITWLNSNNQAALLGEYAGRMPGIAPHAFDQLGFTPTTLDPRFAPLSWEFTQNDAIATELDGHKLIIRVAPENTGWTALKLTFLPPGAFDMNQSVAYFAGSPRVQLEWQVTCVESNQPPLLQQVVPLENSGFTLVARVTVPAGCPAQAWHLRASAGQSQFPSLVQISGLRVVRQ